MHNPQKDNTMLKINITEDEYNRFFLELLYDYGTITPEEFERLEGVKIITDDDYDQVKAHLNQIDDLVWTNRLGYVLERATLKAVHCRIEDYPLPNSNLKLIN